MQSISIVIPCYNEGSDIRNNLQSVLSYVDDRNGFQVICVDDGSTDNTRSEIRKITHPRLELIQYSQNRGKGYAVREGALHSRKKHKGKDILFFDADLSTPIRMIDRINTEVQTSVIIGDRDHPDSEIPEQQGVIRKQVFGTGYRILTNTLLGLRLRDHQCGFKYFPWQTTEIFEQQQINGFAFDAELLYLAKQQGYRIRPIPVVWRNDEDSAVQPLTDVPRMLYDTLRIPLLH